VFCEGFSGFSREERGKVGQERSQVESNPSVNLTEEPVNACGWNRRLCLR